MREASGARTGLLEPRAGFILERETGAEEDAKRDAPIRLGAIKVTRWLMFLRKSMRLHIAAIPPNATNFN